MRNYIYRENYFYIENIAISIRREIFTSVDTGEDEGPIVPDDADVVAVPKLEEAQIDPDSEDLEYPSDCFPDDCYRRFPFLMGDEESPFWQGWANLRLKTFQLIENKYFETAVITMILLSSLALVSMPDAIIFQLISNWTTRLLTRPYEILLKIIIITV